MAGLPMSVAVLWDALRREAGVEVRSADITPEKLGVFLTEIRTQGAAAAQQQYATLQGEYATAYSHYMQLQSELEPLEKARETLLAKVDDQLRRVMEQASKYKLQGRQQRMTLAAQDQSAAAAQMEHPKYLTTVAGLNPTHREWVDRIIFPCDLLRWQVEEAENALWVKHSATAIAQETYQLWNYEMQAAQMQMGELEEEVDAEAYRAQLQRQFLEKRLEEIRLYNKERKKRLRRERFLRTHASDVSRNAPASGPGKSEGNSHNSRCRSEERSRPSVSGASVSSKKQDALSERKRESNTQSHRPSSASPTRPKMSRSKREYKVDPSSWL